MRYTDRREAGRALAARLKTMALPAPVVLALPRGGVPVAAEVARALKAPLDLLLVRKIGAPWQPELAVAAIAEGASPQPLVDEDTRAATGVADDYIQARAAEELQEIARRRALYGAGRAPLPLAGRSAIVVDDGIATGTTVRAALRALRERAPARLVLAVPVAPLSTAARLAGEVDELVCLQRPADFRAVGEFYDDFHQVDDDEVIAELEGFRPRP